MPSAMNLCEFTFAGFEWDEYVVIKVWNNSHHCVFRLLLWQIFLCCRLSTYADRKKAVHHLSCQLKLTVYSTELYSCILKLGFSIGKVLSLSLCFEMDIQIASWNLQLGEYIHSIVECTGATYSLFHGVEFKRLPMSSMRRESKYNVFSIRYRCN